jgi:hypothetical protein
MISASKSTLSLNNLKILSHKETSYEFVQEVLYIPTQGPKKGFAYNKFDL